MRFSTYFTQPALLFALSGDFQKLIFDGFYAAGATFPELSLLRGFLLNVLSRGYQGRAQRFPRARPQRFPYYL